MEFDKIGDMSRAELRRFIVNLLLEDPGALPPSVTSPSKSLPSGANDGDVPVWDAASNAWTTSTVHKVPPTDLAVPSDASKVLNGLGAFVGGVTRIADSTLVGAAANIDFSTIPATFSHLLLVGQLRGDTAAVAVAGNIRFNNDSGANYHYQQLVGNNVTASAAVAVAATQLAIWTGAAATAQAGSASAEVLLIPNYTGTTFFKSCTALDFNSRSTLAAGQFVALDGGIWNSTAAINRVTVIPAAGNWIAGSRVTLYGLG